MRVKSFNNNPMGTNTYIINSNQEAIIVDPVGILKNITDYIEKEKLKVNGIILTHGHADHISLVPDLRELGFGPVFIHEEDEKMLQDPNLNLSPYFGKPISFSSDDNLKDGDEIDIGDEKLKVIHTPGHTPGCICLESREFLITGDTLFRGSIGRTDFPGGDYGTIMASLNKIAKLNPELIIYPGHMEASTLKDELKINPYLK